MNQNAIHILVTIDSNYVHPLCVMLRSLALSNPGEVFVIHLLYADLSERDMMKVADTVQVAGHSLQKHPIHPSVFADAPVGFHFSRAMYYRLLAPELLPVELDRVLYLDPDLLILQSIVPLYRSDISNHAIAAAKESIPFIEVFMRHRLHLPSDCYYFNSGVMLMNLTRIRNTITSAHIWFLRI